MPTQVGLGLTGGKDAAIKGNGNFGCAESGW